MRPTTLELLEKLDDAFRKKFVPLLEDDHARARAAIVVQLIGHLHQRVRTEGESLWAEYAELRPLLADLSPDFPGLDVGAALEAAHDVIPAEVYPSVALQSQRNEILRAAMVKVIEGLDGIPEPRRAEIQTRVFGYLRSQLDRDLELSSAPPLGDAEVSSDLPLV